MHHPSDKTRLVMIGDSRIAMWNNISDLDEYETINRGVSSDTTAQVMLRFSRDVLALDPDLVVIQAGINDLKAIGVFPVQAAWILQQARENISAMLEQSAKRGTAVILMTVLPASEPDIMRRIVWSPEIDGAVAELNKFIRSQAADGVAIMDCDPAFNLAGRINANYAADTLHLNRPGYDVLNRLLRESLKSLSEFRHQKDKPGVIHLN